MRKLDLLRAWVHDYFRHPLENIRQASPIVPGRLYRYYGNIIKATHYGKGENSSRKCDMCALNLKGLPCPYINQLANGEPVCEHYKYIIIKEA